MRIRADHIVDASCPVAIVAQLAAAILLAVKGDPLGVSVALFGAAGAVACIWYRVYIAHYYLGRYYGLEKKP